MLVGFRTDASIEIGSGHVQRCLTLAEALQVKGNDCIFFCRLHAGNMVKYIQDRGFTVKILSIPKYDSIQELKNKHSKWLGVEWSEDAHETIEAMSDNFFDVMIVDHYGIDKRWEKLIKKKCKRLMVIDDLADREHDCDILLDQNYYKNSTKRYKKLLPKKCVSLLGPKYAILRKEFNHYRGQLRERSGKVKNVLIYFGGMDIKNYTLSALKVISKIKINGLMITVIVGNQNPWISEIRLFCIEKGYILYIQTSEVAKIMANSDLAIGAGGISTWERCCLGLPTLAISTAYNQNLQLSDASSIGILYAPMFEGELQKYLNENINLLLKDSKLLKNMSNKALKIVDGLGVSRVVEKINI